MLKLSRLALTLIFCANLAATASAGAYNFQEPADWSVGDPGSTYQNWEASILVPFSAVNSLPTDSEVNPSISSEAKMTVMSPGYVASSGGYYSQNNSYRIFANIYNHGGSFGTGGQYATGYGTRVLLQTAATTNVELDFSIYEDSVEFLNLDNTAFPETRFPQLIGVTEIFRQEGVETPFGPAEQQELLFEYYLPEYSGDFRVRFRAAMHSSFQELRIDTLLVSEAASIPGDFDGDNDVDADDLADWQASYGIDGAADADGDEDSDGRDFLIWQRNYTGPQLIAAFSVPEPTSLMVVIFGIITSLTSRVGISRAI